MTNDLQEILLDEETIRRRVVSLGEEIDAHYADQEILLITLLDGAIVFTADLPKTRSGKIMRRILRKIAEGDTANLGDISTLADPDVVDNLVAGMQ